MHEPASSLSESRLLLLALGFGECFKILDRLLEYVLLLEVFAQWFEKRIESPAECWLEVARVQRPRGILCAHRLDIRVCAVPTIVRLPRDFEFTRAELQQLCNPVDNRAEADVSRLTEGLLDLPVDINLLVSDHDIDVSLNALANRHQPQLGCLHG